MIKYLTGKELCEALGISTTLFTQFPGGDGLRPVRREIR